MNQRGSILIGGAIAIGLLSVALVVTGKLLFNAYAANTRLEAEYATFKENTRKLGEEAERKKREQEAKAKRINDAKLKSLQARMAAANARADGLCKSAGLSAGCRDLPAVPDTAIPVDDKARDQRLLEVLRHAQDTADRLAELQAWVEEQGR